MTFQKYLPLFGLCLLAGCAAQTHDQGMVSQLQVRELQTRTFEDTNLATVMKAMINVLQDEGFIVKSAVLDLGLLTAEKDVEVNASSRSSYSTLFLGKEERWPQRSVLEMSANVTEFGTDTKVRVSFHIRTIDNYGCVTEVCRQVDESAYRKFFSQISKGIFLQSENL